MDHPFMPQYRLRYARQEGIRTCWFDLAVFYFRQRVWHAPANRQSSAEGFGAIWLSLGSRSRRAGFCLRGAALARCGHRLRNFDFCRGALRSGAFAFAHSGVGIFRRSRIAWISILATLNLAAQTAAAGFERA